LSAAAENRSKWSTTPTAGRVFQSLGVRRLLRGQACRPQPFGMIEVHPRAPDPVAAKVEDDRLWRINRRAASLPASFDPSKHKHPIPEIAKLIRGDLELRPVFFGVDGEPLDALASAVAAPIESP